ncbi:UDP-N-acetylglucosamine 2-epimerase [Candidatus Woesearchaeota archaeon]|nr:UDP-N-acetylglucosamine 2-epimerase [Candidatus Woesearchaeota archaeon]
MIGEFNDFLSDWSGRRLDGQLFDRIFSLEGIPLSWFYRPILYSSLLPRPLLSTAEILYKKTTFLSQHIFPSALAFSLEKITKLKPHFFAQKSSGSPQEKILFLTFANHVYFAPEENIPKLEKVIATLRRGPYEPFLLTVDPLSSFSLGKLRQCSHVPYHYHTQKIAKEAAEYAAKLSERWKNIPEQAKVSWMQYKDDNIWKRVKGNLDLLYSRQFVFIIAYYYFVFKEILLREKIKAIVLTGQNNIFEKCMIAAAKQHNLPVLVIQHGIGMGTFKTVDVINNEIFAVWGGCFKKSLLKLGLKEKNIIVTGNLAFDDLKEGHQQQMPHTYVLVTTGCYIEDRFLEKNNYFRIIRKVIGDLNQLDKRIIIKLHPREKYIEEYRKIVGDNPKFTIIKDVGREEYKQLLGEASIIITFGSSIVLEALALGKKAMIIDPFSADSPLPLLYPHVGSTPCRRWDEELVPPFRALLSHKEKPAADEISALLHSLDGQAHTRVVNAIYGMVK